MSPVTGLCITGSTCTIWKSSGSETGAVVPVWGPSCRKQVFTNSRLRAGSYNPFCLARRLVRSSQSDVDFGRERPMNGTLACNLHQFHVLFWSQWPSQFYFDIDSVEHAFFGFAFLAVRCIDARV